MDFNSVIWACLRRWYVMLPILAIAAWNAYGFYESVKPVYYANAVVGAASSNEQVQYSPNGLPVPRNGLLDIGGAQFIMNMVVLGFDDPAVRERVVAAGGERNFTVRMFPSPPSAAIQTALPLIMIEATEADSASATRTVELASQQADSILANIQQQAGVPDSQMVRAIKASSPKTVEGMPSRNKTAALMLMLGAGLAVVAAVAFDYLMIGLRRLRGQRRTPDSPVPVNPDVGPPMPHQGPVLRPPSHRGSSPRVGPG